MKTRTLIDGSKVRELEAAKELTVYTKCPEKWKLVDMETGETYVGHSTTGKHSWNKIYSDGPEIGFDRAKSTEVDNSTQRVVKSK